MIGCDLFIDVPFVRNSQFFAAFATATGKHLAAVLGFHTFTKTVFVLPFPF